jgi:hypothetical protein
MEGDALKQWANGAFSQGFICFFFSWSSIVNPSLSLYFLQPPPPFVHILLLLFPFSRPSLFVCALGGQFLRPSLSSGHLSSCCSSSTAPGFAGPIALHFGSSHSHSNILSPMSSPLDLPRSSPSPGVWWMAETACYHEPKVHDHELYFQLTRLFPNLDL